MPFVYHFNMSLRDTHHSGLRHTASQYANSREETNKHRTQGCQAKSFRATIRKTGGRPSQVLAGTNPTTGRPQSSLNPVFATKFSQSRSLMLMFFFLVARVFGLVGALEAAVTAARKEPYLTDADLTSHRVRLWRGGSASNPAGACPSL